MRSDQANVVITGDGSKTLAHQDHGECYHSTAGARFEAESLYIKASGLNFGDTRRNRISINILDVGLGLGYNALATVAAWHASASPPPLNLTSLEIDPDLVTALASGSASWQDGWSNDWIDWVKKLEVDTRGGRKASFEHPHSKALLSWQIVLGDALSTSPEDLLIKSGSMHYIWQDPFSPDLNPTMWGPDWFKIAYELSAPGAVLMSYSVARTVKDALTSGGWHWERIPASGVKRHWLKATKMPLDDISAPINSELR